MKVLSAIRCAAFVCVTTAISVAGATALADFDYWFSLRGFPQDLGPSFVAAKYNADASHIAGLTACGHTYYLTPAGLSEVQAATTAGDTVQVHRGEPGSAAANSSVTCLIQADQ